MAAFSGLFVGILFVSLCLRSTVGDSSNDDIQQKYSKVVDEVADLRETMMQIKEDMKEMKKISKALNHLCAELQLPGSSIETDIPDKESSSTISTGGKETEAEEDKEQEKGGQLATGPFQIHSIELLDGAFRIEYDENITREVVYTQRENPNIDMTSLEPERLTSTRQGVITGSVTPGSNYVSIMAEDFSASVNFESNNQTPSKIDFEPLEMNSSVQGSVTFQPGQTTEIKVTMGVNDSHHFNLGMYTPFKDRIVIFAMSDSPGIVNISSQKEYPEYKEICITLNGDQEDHEGLLFVSVSRFMPDFKGFVYVYYSVSQILEVRRTDHKEPFEVGYIGFAKFEHKGFNESCEKGTICPLRTTLVGNTPEDVTLWRIIDGKKTQLEVPKLRGEFGRYVIGITFYLSDISDDDQGRYIYRGTSNNGTVIEREFEVTVMSKPRI